MIHDNPLPSPTQIKCLLLYPSQYTSPDDCIIYLFWFLYEVLRCCDGEYHTVYISDVGRSYQKYTHWGIGVFHSRYRGTGAKPIWNLESLIYRSTIYLKLLLTSFNHVINVMDVYTQSTQKYFPLSGIIKLVYNCFPWKLNVTFERSL